MTKKVFINVLNHNEMGSCYVGKWTRRSERGGPALHIAKSIDDRYVFDLGNMWDEVLLKGVVKLLKWQNLKYKIKEGA